jgi:hypothetical protein
VQFGADDEGRLLYGWHVGETTPEGFPFRWTDDLAAVWLASPRQGATLSATYSLAPEHRETFVYLRHTATGAAIAGRLPNAPAHCWITVALESPLPAGPTELILQTPEPYQEPYAGRRHLGVALRECVLD